MKFNIFREIFVQLFLSPNFPIGSKRVLLSPAFHVGFIFGFYFMGVSIIRSGYWYYIVLNSGTLLRALRSIKAPQNKLLFYLVIKSYNLVQVLNHGYSWDILKLRQEPGKGLFSSAIYHVNYSPLSTIWWYFVVRLKSKLIAVFVFLVKIKSPTMKVSHRIGLKPHFLKDQHKVLHI